MIPAGVAAFFAAAWRLIKPPAGRRVALGLALVLIVALAGRGLFDAGVAAEKRAQAARDAKAEKVVAKVASGGVAIAQDVGRKLDAVKVEVRWRTKILKEEVPVYVTAETDRAYPVPVGFVRLHDAAATGSALSAAPGGSVNGPSGVALSAVADTVVENYGTCRIFEAEALAWREWYPRQAALWNANIRAATPPP